MWKLRVLEFLRMDRIAFSSADSSCTSRRRHADRANGFLLVAQTCRLKSLTRNVFGKITSRRSTRSRRRQLTQVLGTYEVGAHVVFGQATQVTPLADRRPSNGRAPWVRRTVSDCDRPRVTCRTECTPTYECSRA